MRKHHTTSSIEENVQSNSSTSLAPCTTLSKMTTTLEHHSLSLDPKSQQNVPLADETVTTSLNELYMLFSPMFDKYFNGATSVVPMSSVVSTTDASDKREQPNTTPSTLTTVVADTTQLDSQTTQELSVTTTENINQVENVMVGEDEFINIFGTSIHEWTRDHPLEQVIENPSQPVRTRRRLETSGEMCMFALIVSRTKPKNINEAMVDHAWIEAMQEELHQFERLKPDGFVDPHQPDKVYHLKKALYGLKQAPTAWYDELSNFLVSKGFPKSSIDPTLFITKHAEDILLVEHGMTSCDIIGTPMSTKPLVVDLSGAPIDQTIYHSMVGSLMYIIASRLDTVYATCYCARYQARPTKEHLKEVKRIFWYIKNIIHVGLWYPKDTGFKLTAFLYSDHVGCLDTRKSTSGGIQLLGSDKLVSGSSKKQNCTLMLIAKAEYVSLSACCAQVLWMRTQLTDYGFYFDKIPIYQFIKVYVERGIVELFFVGTEYQLAVLFTKALSEDRFKYLIRLLGMRCLTLAELEALANEFA
ncbi:retrovirus-related pol polyprotein from transposon TNT 1-94 [Tanacetum coccineum]